MRHGQYEGGMAVRLIAQSVFGFLKRNRRLASCAAYLLVCGSTMLTPQTILSTTDLLRVSVNAPCIPIGGTRTSKPLVSKGTTHENTDVSMPCRRPAPPVVSRTSAWNESCAAFECVSLRCHRYRLVLKSGPIVPAADCRQNRGHLMS